MSQRTKLIMSIILTLIITFLATSYLLKKRAYEVLANSFVEVSAFNEIGRIESWDKVEHILRKGCIKEALELVKMYQYFALSDLRSQIDNSALLIEMVEERNSEIARRIIKVKKPSNFETPTCN